MTWPQHSFDPHGRAWPKELELRLEMPVVLELDEAPHVVGAAHGVVAPLVLEFVLDLHARHASYQDPVRAFALRPLRREVIVQSSDVLHDDGHLVIDDALHFEAECRRGPLLNRVRTDLKRLGRWSSLVYLSDLVELDAESLGKES